MKRRCSPSVHTHHLKMRSGRSNSAGALSDDFSRLIDDLDSVNLITLLTVTLKSLWIRQSGM